MRVLRRVLPLLILALAIASPVAAQETRGSIEGVVKDSSGAVLPGVTVEAKNTSGAVVAATTDEKGVYRFPALPVGTYTITAKLEGFNTANRADILLTLGQQLKADLTMSIGTISETVSVKAEAPIVDVKKNAVSTTITAQTIDLIPKGRDFLDALTGIPGTNDVSRAGGIMIDGATATENRYVVNGVDVSSLDTGTSGRDAAGGNRRIVVDFIEQIQVQRSGYNAEFRAATGGVISAVTKSGTNQYRGELGLNYSGPRLNRTLQGKVRPTLNISTIDNVSLEYAYAQRAHDTSTIEPVFQMGGPILRDRAWFFVGAAPSWQEQKRTVTWSIQNPVGPQTQTFSDIEKSYQYTGTVTTQVRSNLRLRLDGMTGHTDPGVTVPGIDLGTGISTSNPRNFNPQATVRTFNDSKSFSGTFDWTATDSVFASVTAGWFDSNNYSAGGEAYQGTRRVNSVSTLNYATMPVELRRAANFNENPANTFNAKDLTQRLTLNSDVTAFRTWKGQHALKAGVQYERLGNQVDEGQQFLNITFFYDRSFQPAAGGAPVRGTYGYYRAERSFTGGDVSSHNVGLFLQDQWSVNSRLTFNYGLRTDRTVMPSYRPENPSLEFGFAQKLAPRLGFAYDLRGDARWKLYGSWGVFYDIEKLEMPRGAWGADNWIQYTYTLDTLDWPNVDCTDVNGASGCPGTLLERFDRRHVSNDPNDPLVDPDLEPMRAQEATIGLDHELSNIMSIGLRYTHKWLNSAIEDVGVIDPVVGAEIFFIANPGKRIGEFPLGPSYPGTPEAKRVYDGFDISFNRRLHNNWALNANMVVSRLWGNYTGLTNAQSESGRNAPNVTRAFDGLYMSFDSKGNPTYGRMGSDIPLQFKVLGTYLMPWGTSLGVDFRANSGLLHTTTVNYQSVPVPVEGYGDLGRTPFFNQTNMLVSHTFRLPGATSLRVELNVNNVFDQDIVTAYDTTPYLNGSLSFPGDAVNDRHAFFNGFDWKANMAAVNAATPTLGQLDPRYGSNLGTGFQTARSVRLYARFTF